MATSTGAYSGSGKDPIPAKGSFLESDGQDTAKQRSPDFGDPAGGMSAPRPTKGNKYLGGTPNSTDSIFKD